MAYDEDLANRIRELLGPEKGIEEKRMFGGLAFLINGNMSVAVSGQGGLMVRVPPDDTDKLLARAHVSPMLTSTECRPSGSFRVGSPRAWATRAVCPPNSRPGLRRFVRARCGYAAGYGQAGACGATTPQGRRHHLRG
jgi:TfoX N-terminal domain